MDTRDYHHNELAVALSADDTRRSLPPVPPDCRRVLDIGCGIGQTLLACNLESGKAFGVDIDLDALQAGSRLNGSIYFAQAVGEALPFRSESFDYLFSRVALPYMNIPTALGEMARVVRPGGGIWVSLHPLSMLSWRNALGSLKRTLFELYRLANTLHLHYGGTPFRYPLNSARLETYQTERGMRTALGRVGFEDVRIIQHVGEQFIVTARKQLAG